MYNECNVDRYLHDKDASQYSYVFKLYICFLLIIKPVFYVLWSPRSWNWILEFTELDFCSVCVRVCVWGA